MDGKRKKQDYILSLVVFILIAIGLIMIYSVSKYYSLQLTNGATDKYFLKKQIVFTLIGLVAWVIFQSIDYRFWQKKSFWMLPLTLFLLVLPLLIGGQSERWVNLGFFQFQPSELAKLTFIIYLSGWFSSKKENLAEIKKMFVPFVCAVAMVCFLLYLQKDLGTMSVFVIISSVIFMVAGSSMIHLIASGGLVAFLLWLTIKFEPYRMQRVMTFLNPETNVSGSGYHIRNALIAIGSGGLWGLGFGQSRQKYLYLPEAQTDSIFAIAAEEMGFIRTSFLLILFTMLALRGYKIAQEAPDFFSRLLAAGITTWICVQAFINIAAMLSIVPLTGIPLPFVSAGGTSLIVLIAGVGILVNISKQRIQNGWR